MIGAKVAAVALNVALTMGLSYAIQAVVSGLDNLIHASTNASEAADELKNSSMQAAEEANEETKKLDELIKKYEELAKSDNQDSSTRTEIKQVQSDIVDLVGQQANNLDLVNGKLDDELEKLNQIRREEAARAVDSNVSAYHNARDSADKARGSGKASWEHPSIGDGWDYIGDRDKEAEQILKDAGFAYGLNITTGGWLDNTLYMTALGSTAKERAD